MSGNEMYSMKDGKKVDAHIHEGILNNPEAEKKIESIRLRKKAERRDMMARQLREIRMASPQAAPPDAQIDAPPGIKLVPVDYDPFKDEQ